MAYFLSDMEIILKNVGKKFIYDWVFRKIDLKLKNNEIYAITGPNGSGKSTFLQVLSGMQPATEGEIVYKENDKVITSDKIFKYVTIAAPYLELIEEMTLTELINFHLQFKNFNSKISVTDFIDIIRLPKAKNKTVNFFSSGMKQRLKLGLALYSDCPILILDEPASNLDKEGFDWYKEEIIKNSICRLVLIASNQTQEYDFLTENIIKIK